jgi:hypothetical protein
LTGVRRHAKDGRPNTTEFAMAGNKEMFSFEARDYQLSFLRDMMQKYRIKDEGKALRVLLDYAVSDGDLDLIFDKKNMRCIACGGVV